MSKFYCPAPWHAGYFTHNHQSVCCVHPGVDIDSPFEYIKGQEIFKIKQGIASGNLTPTCQECKDDDDAGYFNVSQSHRELARYFDVELINDPSVDTVPQMIEIRFSNLCNFKCRMCGPEWSSMIASENAKHPTMTRWYGKNTPLEKLDATPRFIDDAKKMLKNLKRIYITGGEPTIQKEVIEFIDYMIDNRFNESIVIQLATNASAINPAILNRLRQFKNVNLTLSIDGIGDIAEYQRHGTIWKNVDSNIKSIGEFKLSYPDRINLNIHTALSAYTVLGIDQLTSYCLDLIDRYHIVSWNLARVKSALAPISLSGNLRINAIQSLNQAIEILNLSSIAGSELYQNLYVQFSTLKTELENTASSPDEWKKFCELTQSLDVIRNEDFSKVFGLALTH